MASRRWVEAHELLEATDAICAESVCTIQQLREHETELWRELTDLREDLARFETVAEALVDVRTRLSHLLERDGDE